MLEVRNLFFFLISKCLTFPSNNDFIFLLKPTVSIKEYRFFFGIFFRYSINWVSISCIDIDVKQLRATEYNLVRFESKYREIKTTSQTLHCISNGEQMAAVTCVFRWECVELDSRLFLSHCKRPPERECCRKEVQVQDVVTGEIDKA